MAYYGTQYYDPEEDDLPEDAGAVAPAPAEPDRQPLVEPSADEPRPEWDAEPRVDPLLALASRTQQPAKEAPQLGEPPKLREGADWSMIGAGILDLALNDGRNAGRFMEAIANGPDRAKYENYRRLAERAKLQSDMDNKYAYGGRGSRGMSPEQIELQRQRLEQGNRRLSNQEEQTKLSGDRLAQSRAQWEELNKIGSPTHAALIDWAVQNKVGTREQLQGLPAAQLSKTFPAINAYLQNTGAIGEAREGQAAETAGAVSKATLEDRITVAREGALARGEAEAVSPSFKLREDEAYRSATDQYAKETEKYRTIAQQTHRMSAVISKYKPGELPGVGLGTQFVPDSVYSLKGNIDALEVRNAQRLMNDVVTRVQTGAAAPVSEQAMLQMITGSKPGATEEEFLVGMRAMEEYSVGQLRAFSAGKEGAARDVLQQQGIDAMVFPPQKAKPKAKAPAAPRPAAAPTRDAPLYAPGQVVDDVDDPDWN